MELLECRCHTSPDLPSPKQTGNGRFSSTDIASGSAGQIPQHQDPYSAVTRLSCLSMAETVCTKELGPVTLASSANSFRSCCSYIGHALDAVAKQYHSDARCTCNSQHNQNHWQQIAVSMLLSIQEHGCYKSKRHAPGNIYVPVCSR